MQPQTRMAITSEEDARIEQKVQKLRELYADAPELGRAALERGLADLKRELAAELAGIIPFAPGGAQRLRGLLQALEGNFRGGDAVGTLHDMRFVFLDNDTKLLFATAYDGDWDAYIDDFVT